MRMDSSHLKAAQTDSSGGSVRVLLLTQSSAHAFWLAGALGDEAEVVPVALDMLHLEPHLSESGLGVVMVDFSAPATEAAALLAADLRSGWPGVVLMGAGSAVDAASMLAALRCGVTEFVNWDASEADARTAFKRQLYAPAAPAAAPVPAAVSVEDTSVAIPLLGGRVGMGVTTLAVHLAVMLQEMQAHDVRGAVRRHQVARKAGASQLPPEEAAHAALLDLGLPARDGLLYLDVAGSYSFVDAVQNLRRLDATLLDSAVEKHFTGTAALAWPADLSLLREVSPTAAANVIRTFKALLKAQVIDLGGMVQADFLAPVLRECGQAWVVCDQSLGGIVSTAQMIRELESKGIERSSLKLVLNRFNAQAGLPAKEVAQRLGLELLHVVPDRGTALLAAASSGQLLSQTLRGDPYVTSVRTMARALLGEPMAGPAPAAPAPGILSQWAKRLRRGE